MNAHVQYPQVSPVVRSQLNFKLDEVPRFWFGGDPYITRMFDALSLTFPDGERYFIESVRLFRDKITDEDLQQRVADFIRQEAQHGMAHDKMNQVMKEQGMPVEQFIRRLNRIFKFELKNRSAQYNIAMTANRAFDCTDGRDFLWKQKHLKRCPPLCARIIGLACH